ncbi:MAG TPA: hypothetical protein VFH45_11485, partial [Acidimicrobiales bacterium]|nr:hypothetical protein [Acidimicrobiales bacterium]
WAERLDAEVPQAAEWAAGRAAILAAVSVCSGRQLPAPAAKGAERLLGRRWRDARSLADLAGALPRSAAWPLAAIADPQDLWRSEARWWGRLAEDGLLMARTPRPGPGPVVGAAASLMADAWQLGAALEVALRGGREPDHVLG